MINSKPCGVAVSVCLLALAGTWTLPAVSQAAEVKEKPPMYTFVSNWTLPRARWGELEKQSAAATKVMEKAFADGTIIAYGDDTTVVHTADGSTHDRFWSATSTAGLLKVLDAIFSSGGATTSVLSSATKHWDGMYVSRFYGWHPGSMKGAYTHVATYKLKQDAPNDAVENISKAFIVPLLEKLLADGTISEYEIDEQVLHTEAPGTFSVVYITPDAEGIDKVRAALIQSLGSQSLAGPAFNSMVDFTAHRDELARTNATYK